MQQEVVIRYRHFGTDKFLTLEDRTVMLSRNVGNELPLLGAQ